MKTSELEDLAQKLAHGTMDTDQLAYLENIIVEQTKLIDRCNLYCKTQEGKDLNRESQENLSKIKRENYKRGKVIFDLLKGYEKLKQQSTLDQLAAPPRMKLRSYPDMPPPPPGPLQRPPKKPALGPKP